MVHDGAPLPSAVVVYVIRVLSAIRALTRSFFDEADGRSTKSIQLDTCSGRDATRIDRGTAGEGTCGVSVRHLFD